MFLLCLFPDGVLTSVISAQASTTKAYDVATVNKVSSFLCMSGYDSPHAAHTVTSASRASEIASFIEANEANEFEGFATIFKAVKEGSGASCSHSA